MPEQRGGPLAKTEPVGGAHMLLPIRKSVPSTGPESKVAFVNAPTGQGRCFGRGREIFNAQSTDSPDRRKPAQKRRLKCMSSVPP